MSCQPLHRALAAVVCALCLSVCALAAEVDSDQVYCFGAGDFAPGDETLTGVCVTAVPEASHGTMVLGTRVIRAGDILTRGQLEQLTFRPVRAEADQEASVRYLPIFNGRVDPEATMVISIHGKEDKAPVAEDSGLETYKNLENQGTLKAHDPEGQALTFSVLRQPRRGTVTIHDDGSFTYTPKKNKVGTDSFTYTATDPAGNVSREATVTVEIRKPTDARQYTDTVGTDCQFTAQWLHDTGIFSGETVSGQSCFCPEAEVSRGEFLAMLMQVLELPVDRSAMYTGFSDECADWLKPYLAAAMGCGLVSGYPDASGAVFCPEQTITGNEAAMMISSALSLSAPADAAVDESVPVWAARSRAAVNAQGLALPADGGLTRADCANILYQVSCLAQSAENPIFAS